MKKLVLFLTLLTIGKLIAQPVIDGNASEWARWDYNIVTRTGSGNNNHNIWDQNYSLNQTGLYALDVVNGIIEGRIPWTSLGGAPGANTFYFTFAIYRANGDDDTFDTGTDNSKGDCLDYITTTSTNTYFALIGVSAGGTNNVGRLDYTANIDFLSVNQPLPVELSTFYATVIGNYIKLSWRTETETDNYGFEIERDAKVTGQIKDVWEKIGFVNGSGNSNSPINYEFIDRGLKTGTYSYRLKQIDNDGSYDYSKVIAIDYGMALKYDLTQNYPNPFNPVTKISYALPSASMVDLKVYNVLGQLIITLVNEEKPAGFYEVDFNAADLPSGVYIYRIQAVPNGRQAGDYAETKKMILLK
jgi:hypothetical protein